MLTSISNPRRAAAAATLAAIIAVGAHSPAVAEAELQPSQLQLASVEAPAFLANTGATALTTDEMNEIQGEGWPVLLYYAVLAAPTLHSLLSSSIANHFPVMLIRHAWTEFRK